MISYFMSNLFTTYATKFKIMYCKFIDMKCSVDFKISDAAFVQYKPYKIIYQIA